MSHRTRKFMGLFGSLHILRCFRNQKSPSSGMILNQRMSHMPRGEALRTLFLININSEIALRFFSEAASQQCSFKADYHSFGRHKRCSVLGVWLLNWLESLKQVYSHVRLYRYNQREPYLKVDLNFYWLPDSDQGNTSHERLIFPCPFLAWEWSAPGNQHLPIPVKQTWPCSAQHWLALKNGTEVPWMFTRRIICSLTWIHIFLITRNGRYNWLDGFMIPLAGIENIPVELELVEHSKATLVVISLP